jgi:hypothetical protein
MSSLSSVVRVFGFDFFFMGYPRLLCLSFLGGPFLHTILISDALFILF